MRPFIPVLLFAVLTFPMLAGWIEFSGASPDLRPLLYLARLVAWLVALFAVAVLFFPFIWRRRIKMPGAILLGATAVLIHYACFGFLTAHAEERVIQYRTEHRDPHDDMGPHWLYGEFSGSGYSRGAYDVYRKTWGGLQSGLVSVFIWFPIIFLASRRLYRHATPQPSTHNA